MTDDASTGAGLRARDLTAGYGARAVIDGLHLDVPRGRFTAVIGPNGCGKSTLVRALSRTLRPMRGVVEIDGAPAHRMPTRHVARTLAFLPQEPIAPEGVTVRSLVSRGRHPYHSAWRRSHPGDAAAIAGALEATEMLDLVDAPIASLSGGQRQRAWIALVLAQETEYVLLDEPTSFLDIGHQIDVLRLCGRMRSEGRTVVAVLHDLSQAARFADRLVLMHDGGIVAEGEPAAVLTERNVREVFGLDCRIAPDPVSGTPMVVPLG
ncbi:ABC transporter ATP-binding protein [Microbacterium sp.]|uniref:ABC transporter ATP-binding protein n=1 Tax=Microbacterium sp. TaxID=51671 RepID=UPI003F987ACD